MLVRALFVATVLLCLLVVPGLPLTGAMAEGSPSSLGTDATGPMPIVAYTDSGINPYHMAFRAPDWTEHPATFIEGYPEDALPLNLTFDADTVLDAVWVHDKHVWDSIEIGQVYYIPGTRIIGLVKLHEDAPVIDRSGHGTSVADAGAGNEHGVAPEAGIVLIQDRQAEAFEWMQDQPWIDVISASYGPIQGLQPVGYPKGPKVLGYRPGFSHELVNSYELREQGRLSFWAAGNGPQDSGAVNLLSHSATPWQFTVGGVFPIEDPVVCRDCTRPFNAASDWTGALARHDSFSENAEVSSTGTSVASPRMAAHAALVIQAARGVLGDEERFRDGAYAIAPDGAVLPERGPLSDGRFTADELEDIMMRAAVPVGMYLWPVPVITEVPEEVRYPTQGHGWFNDDSLDFAVEVLRGNATLPERPWDDWWHETLDSVMMRYWSTILCTNEYEWGEWSGCDQALDDPEAVDDPVWANPLVPSGGTPLSAPPGPVPCADALLPAVATGPALVSLYLSTCDDTSAFFRLPL